MKKDLPFILGGLAVGALVLFVFKDKIMGKPKAKSSSEGAGVPLTTAGIGPSTGSAPAPQSQTGGVKPPPAQGQQTAGGAQQPAQQPALPYAAIAIDPSLAGSEWHPENLWGLFLPNYCGSI